MRDEPQHGAEAAGGISFDQAGLEALYASQERAVFNVVLRWTWNVDDAAEIVQEAFARVWSMRTKVDPGRAKALVFRIAVNLAASKRRWRRIRTFVGLEDAGGSAVPPRIEADLMARQRWDAVRGALDRLPESLRQTLVLCELSELSYAEVAKVTGVRLGTVGSRRNAALRRVRAALNFASQESDA